jgi:type IV secretory pathway VirB10-like protein
VKYVVAGSCIAASVRQTVYDSRHPDIVLIPQGTRLMGLCTTPAAT